MNMELRAAKLRGISISPPPFEGKEGVICLLPFIPHFSIERWGYSGQTNKIEHPHFLGSASGDSLFQLPPRTLVSLELVFSLHCILL
jgi:hypothetical protein